MCQRVIEEERFTLHYVPDKYCIQEMLLKKGHMRWIMFPIVSSHLKCWDTLLLIKALIVMRTLMSLLSGTMTVSTQESESTGKRKVITCSMASIKMMELVCARR